MLGIWKWSETLARQDKSKGREAIINGHHFPWNDAYLASYIIDKLSSNKLIISCCELKSVSILYNLLFCLSDFFCYPSYFIQTCFKLILIFALIFPAFFYHSLSFFKKNNCFNKIINFFFTYTFILVTKH